MEVDATPAGDVQHRLGKDLAVGCDHHHVRGQGCELLTCSLASKRLRLPKGDSMALRTERDRAGRQAQPPAGGAIRLGEYEGYVVPCEHERVEGGNGEGGGAGENDAQGQPRQAALRWRFFNLARMRFCLRSERCSTKMRPDR